MIVVQIICSSLYWCPSPVIVLAAGDGEGSAAAAAAGASVLKMGRFQVGRCSAHMALGTASWAGSSCCQLCVPCAGLCCACRAWESRAEMLCPFRAGIAQAVQVWSCEHRVSSWLWSLMLGCSFAKSAGMFTVLCPAGEGGPIWGCWFLGLILQVTHECCFVWQCSAWREAVACFVAYLGNELFSPLRCILPLREIKAPR